MKLGQQALEALQAEITGETEPGRRSGSSGRNRNIRYLVLISQEKEKLRKYFESFLYERRYFAEM